MNLAEFIEILLFELRECTQASPPPYHIDTISRYGYVEAAHSTYETSPQDIRVSQGLVSFRGQPRACGIQASAGQQRQAIRLEKALMGRLMTEATVSELLSTWQCLDQGLSPEHLKQLRLNKRLQYHVVDAILNQDTGSMDPGTARQIMMRLFGAEEWEHLVSDPIQKSTRIPRFPWTADVLFSPCPFVPGMLVKDTHFAFLGRHDQSWRVGEKVRHYVYLSLHGWQDRLGEDRVAIKASLDDTKTCDFQWYLAFLGEGLDPRKGLSPHLITMLPPQYRALSAQEELTRHITWDLVGGELGPLPEGTYRTGDANTRGPIVIVVSGGVSEPKRFEIIHDPTCQGFATATRVPGI